MEHKSKSALLNQETINQEEEDGEFDFQPYIDSVKQKIIPWHLFEKTMIDLSRSNIQRLRYLNAILLTELTYKLFRHETYEISEFNFNDGI